MKVVVGIVFCVTLYTALAVEPSESNCLTAKNKEQYCNQFLNCHSCSQHKDCRWCGVSMSIMSGAVYDAAILGLCVSKTSTRCNEDDVGQIKKLSAFKIMGLTPVELKFSFVDKDGKQCSEDNTIPSVMNYSNKKSCRQQPGLGWCYISVTVNVLMFSGTSEGGLCLPSYLGQLCSTDILPERLQFAIGHHDIVVILNKASFVGKLQNTILPPKDQQCESHRSCKKCLDSSECKWCGMKFEVGGSYDKLIPQIGKCMKKTDTCSETEPLYSNLQPIFKKLGSSIFKEINDKRSKQCTLLEVPMELDIQDEEECNKESCAIRGWCTVGNNLTGFCLPNSLSGLCQHAVLRYVNETAEYTGCEDEIFCHPDKSSKDEL